MDMSLRFASLSESPLSDNEMAYAHYLSRLLNSPPGSLLPRLATKRATGGPLTQEDDDLDLLVYWEPERPWWKRWLGLTPAVRVADQTRASVMVVRQPRWPLRRILLILRAHETDEIAIRWLARLARPAEADVFLLPIIPPVPALYRHGSIPLQAEVLLAPNTFSGMQIRRLELLCASWNIQGTLLMHDSHPQQRMKWATAASDCDLIIISDEPYHWIHRWFLGELVRPLLRANSDRSLLLARPATV